MTDQKLPSGVQAGWILLVTAIASVFFMLHHPVLGSPGYENVVEEVIAKSGINKFVHGSMIIASLLFYHALSVLSARLGRHQATVRAADISFAFATITMIGAALYSGFIVSELAERLVDDGAEGVQTFRLLLNLTWETNQALANAGTFGYSAALLFWSIALFQREGLTRLIALPGFAAAILMPAGILTGHLQLDLHGMTLVLFLFILWCCLVSIQMIRRKI